MSSVASPFGLRPASHPSGVIRQVQGTIISGLAQNIFQYSAIRWADATGGIVLCATAVAAVLGSFMGVEFTNTEGRRQVSNRWVSGTVATDIVAYFTMDPDITYEMQSEGSVAQLNVGDMADYNAQTGNTTTGLSTTALDGTMAAAAAQMRIVGINPAPDNVPGDDFTIVQVQIAEHAFNAYTVIKLA